MPRVRRLFPLSREAKATDDGDVSVDYRKQAVELRARAAKSTDAALKEELIAMAKRFERLAEIRTPRS